MPKILDSVLDKIGDTPLIRINALSTDLDCELLAKVCVCARLSFVSRARTQKITSQSHHSSTLDG
jgi:cysteine synthase